MGTWLPDTWVIGQAAVSGKTTERMAVSVMVQTQRSDKSDKDNCGLASPRSKKLRRPLKSSSALILLPQNFSH